MSCEHVRVYLSTFAFIDGDMYGIIVPYKYMQWFLSINLVHHAPSRLTIILSIQTLLSVETPSKVDPQWNILYRGSRWILITACLGAVGCEWGTTPVYFGVIYVCFVPRILPVFVVGPKYQHPFFLFMSRISFEGHKQILQKIPCRFKTWMGLVGQILIKLKTSFIRGFLQLPFEALLGQTCWWPLSDHWSVHLTCPGLCGMEVWKLIGPICAMHDYINLCTPITYTCHTRGV